MASKRQKLGLPGENGSRNAKSYVESGAPTNDSVGGA